MGEHLSNSFWWCVFLYIFFFDTWSCIFLFYLGSSGFFSLFFFLCSSFLFSLLLFSLLCCFFVFSSFSFSVVVYSSILVPLHVLFWRCQIFIFYLFLSLILTNDCLYYISQSNCIFIFTFFSYKAAFFSARVSFFFVLSFCIFFPVLLVRFLYLFFNLFNPFFYSCF